MWEARAILLSTTNGSLAATCLDSTAKLGSGYSHRSLSWISIGVATAVITEIFEVWTLFSDFKRPVWAWHCYQKGIAIAIVSCVLYIAAITMPKTLVSGHLALQKSPMTWCKPVHVPRKNEVPLGLVTKVKASLAQNAKTAKALLLHDMEQNFVFPLRMLIAFFASVFFASYMAWKLIQIINFLYERVYQIEDTAHQVIITTFFFRSCTTHAFVYSNM